MTKSFADVLASSKPPHIEPNSLEIDSLRLKEFCWQTMGIEVFAKYPLFVSNLKISLELQKLAQTSAEPVAEITEPFYVWLVKSNKDMHFIVATPLPVYHAHMPQDPWVEGEEWKEFSRAIAKKLGINHALTLDEVREAEGNTIVISWFDFMEIDNKRFCIFAYKV